MNSFHPVFQTYLGIPGTFVFRTIFIVSIAFFFYSLFRRIHVLRQAGPDPRFGSWKARLSGLLLDGFLQRRQPRYLLAWVLHIVIFWGFVVLALGSVTMLAEGLAGSTPGHRVDGIYPVAKDVFELAVLVACGIAIWRRAVRRPERYRDSHQAEAYAVLLIIAFLMMTDIFFSAIAIAMDPAQTVRTPVSGAASLLFRATDAAWLNGMLATSYWLHLLCFCVLLNMLPLSKHFHIITALPNVMFRKLNRGELKPPDWRHPDLDDLDRAGAGRITDFTWKQVLDLFSCTECGRCTDNCPAHRVGRDLSPKRVTMQLRDQAYRQFPIVAFGKNNAPGQADEIVGHAVNPASVWSCTTCGACEAQCPVFIEHIDKIIDLRRHAVMMNSDFPEELRNLFRNLETYGDPWGMGAARRWEWAEDLKPMHVEEKAADTIYWVGCAGAFDQRYGRVARAVVNILNRASLEVGLLGTVERCCGDVARRTGNELLFQQLAKANITLLKQYGVKRIIVSCPHGYNALKHEYPKYGGHFEVVHHSELIGDLLDSGRLRLTRPANQRIVYHDACYLGRHNGSYARPREVLRRVPGMTLIEAPRNREHGFCCGAGGGYMWLVETGTRVNEKRTEELLALETELISTACPFCLTMLEEGISAGGGDRRPAVLDIAEIVENAL